MNTPRLAARLLGGAALASSAWLATVHAAPAVPRPAVTAPSKPTASAKPAPVWRLKPADSMLQFTAKQIGVPMEGHFKRYEAQVQLDPRQPESGQVKVSIDLASASMSADGAELLPDPAWFNTPKFPRAEFVSKQIRSSGPGRLEVAGVFTLKGVARPLTVPVTLVSSGNSLVATGQFTLQRLAFQVGSGEWADTNVVANDVQVKFTLTLLNPSAQP